MIQFIASLLIGEVVGVTDFAIRTAIVFFAATLLIRQLRR